MMTALVPFGRAIPESERVKGCSCSWGWASTLVSRISLSVERTSQRFAKCSQPVSPCRTVTWKVHFPLEPWLALTFTISASPAKAGNKAETKSHKVKKRKNTDITSFSMLSRQLLCQNHIQWNSRDIKLNLWSISSLEQDIPSETHVSKESELALKLNQHKKLNHYLF